MAKGQMRPNKETRKPKKDKAAAAAGKPGTPAPAAASGSKFATPQPELVTKKKPK